MNYFTEVFIPARERVFKHLFSSHPRLLGLKTVFLGRTYRFGVRYSEEDRIYEYTVQENSDGSVNVDEGFVDLEFSVLKIPMKLLLNVDEKYLKEWVAREEGMMKRPLSYFLYYILKTLPRVRISI